MALKKWLHVVSRCLRFRMKSTWVNFISILLEHMTILCQWGKHRNKYCKMNSNVLSSAYTNNNNIITQFCPSTVMREKCFYFWANNCYLRSKTLELMKGSRNLKLKARHTMKRGNSWTGGHVRQLVKPLSHSKGFNFHVQFQLLSKENNSMPTVTFWFLFSFFFSDCIGYQWQKEEVKEHREAQLLYTFWLKLFLNQQSLQTWNQRSTIVWISWQ